MKLTKSEFARGLAEKIDAQSIRLMSLSRGLVTLDVTVLGTGAL